MSDLSQSDKLSSRSLPAIVNGLDALASQLRAEGWKYRGSRLTKEAVHNAAVMHFLSLHADEQRTILALRIAELERAVGREPSPQPIPSPVPATGARLISRRVETKRPAKPPKPSRTKAD